MPTTTHTTPTHCAPLHSQEAAPAAPGLRKRKVTILGDTVNSKPIAPLALGTDVLAHEATFSAVGALFFHPYFTPP